MSHRRAFTLLEVLATLLLLTLGVTAILAMMRYGTSVSIDAQVRTTALLVAETLTVDPTPGDLTADLGDADGDGWMLASGTLAAPAAGSYEFAVEGYLNGFYLRRVEASTPSQIVDPTQRWATITVDVYAADDGAYVTTTKQRMLRQTRAP